MISCRYLVAFGFIALSLSGCNNSKTAKDIGKQAGESLVLINYADKSGHGTGFLVQGENTQVCTILTVRHVVPPSTELKLQTPDKKIWKAENIKRFPKQDLAVITFKADAASCPYKTLSLGNSDKVDVTDTVYIAGFPTSSTRQFTVGAVSLIDNQTEGYGISYTAITAAGMSGAPVINTAGEVVAVHGRTDVELATQAEIKGEEPPPQQQSKTGANSTNGDAVGTFKWGIPINIYVANVAQVTKEAEEANQKAQDFYNEGNDFYTVQNYSNAIASYDKAIALKPDYADAWISRGNALNNLTRYEEAIKSYDKATKFDPNNQRAINNRKQLLTKLGRSK